MPLPWEGCWSREMLLGPDRRHARPALALGHSQELDQDGRQRRAKSLGAVGGTWPCWNRRAWWPSAPRAW